MVKLQNNMEYHCITGWWFFATPLKNMRESQFWDDYRNPINEWENKIHGNQTTNQTITWKYMEVSPKQGEHYHSSKI